MGKKATFYLIHVIIVAVTIVLSALTIVCSFASYVEPAKSEFLTFLSLGIIPLLIVNFLFLFYWIIRFRIWFIVPLVAIVANYSYLSSIFQFSLSSENAKYDLKVATYNVHNFRVYELNFTVHEIAQFFKQENVDVVCLQEFAVGRNYGLDSIRAAFSYLPYYAAPLNKSKEMDLIVLSRYPLSAAKLFTYDYSGNSFMRVNLNVNGRELLLINAHLQTTSVSQSNRELAAVMDAEFTEETKNAINVLGGRLYNNYTKRAEQVNDIAKIITASKKPVILCGDFNDLPSSYVYRRVIDTGLKDGFKTAGSGYEYTFRPYFKLLRIDYIFHSDVLPGINYYSSNIKTSDHKPVMMEFQIK